MSDVAHVCGPPHDYAAAARVAKEDSDLIVGLHRVAATLLGAPDDHHVEVRVTCRTCKVAITID